MHGLPTYEYFLAVLETALLGALIVRFLWLRLQTSYRFFFAFLVLDFIQSCVGISIHNIRTNFYVYAFMATEGVLVCSCALVVLELYSTIFNDLRGISSVARRYIKVALALAIGTSLLILKLERTPTNLLQAFYTFDRAIVCSLLLFVLLITVLLWYYPIPLNRNMIVYSIGYAAYFLTRGSAFFLLNTGHAWQRIFSLILLLIDTGCVVLWLTFLKREEGERRAIYGDRWRPGDQQRLLEQLQAINSSLLRGARK